MLENSQIDKVESTVDGAERGNPISITGMDSPVEIEQPQVEITGSLAGTPYDAMCKAIRASGWWLVAWTVFSIFQPNLPWAAVLITIALMSFYFYDVAAMFLVYTGMLFWAAATNLLSAEPEWIFVAVLQVVFGILSLRDYRIYRTAKASCGSSPVSPGSSTGREAHMALFALILGFIGLVGLCGIIPAGVVLYYEPGDTFEQVATNLLGTLWELSILGISVGIAALSINRRSWGAAAMGIVVGAIILLVSLISLLLPNGL